MLPLYKYQFNLRTLRLKRTICYTSHANFIWIFDQLKPHGSERKITFELLPRPLDDDGSPPPWSIESKKKLRPLGLFDGWLPFSSSSNRTVFRRMASWLLLRTPKLFSGICWKNLRGRVVCRQSVIFKLEKKGRKWIKLHEFVPWKLPDNLTYELSTMIFTVVKNFHDEFKFTPLDI